MQFITVLAGHQFTRPEAKVALAETRMGTQHSLRLERDPENAWDPNAVRVLLTLTGQPEAYFIGHVSAVVAAQLAHYLDNDQAARENDGNPLWAEDHTPVVERVEIIDWVSDDKKPTIVIEVSTGFELGTLVRGDDEDEDLNREARSGDEEDDELGED